MSDVEQGIPIEDDIPAASVQPPKNRFISIVWLIPIVAFCIGGWLVYKTLSEKGPTITITFKSANGLEAGKTRISYKEVDLGKVTKIELSEDLSHVIVSAALAKSAATFLSENTRFWVVRARVAARGVSGLGTLFSGAYITLDPGKPGSFIESFQGIEEPPAVATDAPGRTFYLKALRRGSIDTGSPVLYRQIEAGQVVSYNLSKDGKIVTLKVFISAPYHRFVYQNTRFWNASGIDFKLDSQGVRIDTDSVVSLLIGGISFGIPQGTEPDVQAEEHAEFILYDNLDKARETAYLDKQRWLIYFDETVRGLSPGAPVEVQGIRVGEVLDVSLEYDNYKQGFRIPVLVEFEPERVFTTAGPLTDEKRRQLIEGLVKQGYRAQLETGNLLTGQLIVTLSRFPDATPAAIEWREPYPVFPTIPKTIQQIKVKVARIIDRMDKMPIEQIGKDLQAAVHGAKRLVDSPELARSLKNLDGTIEEARLMINDLRATVAPQLTATLEEARKAMENAGDMLKTDSPLQTRMKSALDEVARASRSLRQLMDYLERHPESIISGKGSDE
ncbi:MAG: MCE family protein [Desulfobacterales bacterium]|nr:MCE family protein [Desulfobacterales bacterium]